jgi:putative phosphoribosyl transferase
MGAIAEGGVQVLNHDLIDDLGIQPDDVARVASREQTELERRRVAYRGERTSPIVRDHVVILVDDGLATGATMEAAVKAVKMAEPKEVIVAVPVGAMETCERLRRFADRVICLHTPNPFSAVGLWYRDFSEVGDAEVARLLQSALPKRS